MRFSYVLAQSSRLFREGGTLFLTISYNEMTFFFFIIIFILSPRGAGRKDRRRIGIQLNRKAWIMAPVRMSRVKG